MGCVKEKYVKEYYLGGKDRRTGKPYGAEGSEIFREGKIAPKFYRHFQHIDVKDKAVLDIGCGRGEILKICAERGAKEIMGIDFSKDALEIASAFTKGARNITLLNMEARDITFRDKFDVIFMLDVIEHIPDSEMQQVYPKVYSALRQGGMLAVSTPLYNSADCVDKTDLAEATEGMHCNKQTKKKLVEDLKRNKFRCYSPSYWVKSANPDIWRLINLRLRFWRWTLIDETRKMLNRVKRGAGSGLF